MFTAFCPIFGEVKMSTSNTSPFWSGSVADRRMSAGLARNWWAIALRGVAAIVFGLIAIFLPGVTMLSLVLVFAAYMLVDGAMGIVSAVRAARLGEAWTLLAFAGVVNIAAAILAAAWPGITVLVFVMIVAASEIVSGGLMFSSALNLEQDHGRWWLALGGVLSMAFGVILIITPLVGALVLTWWLGIYAIAFGIVLLLLAFRLRSRHVENFGSPAPQNP
jgi:uncharacterized membrane protein HdeD (DUF308 family)